MGAGLLEGAYDHFLCHELSKNGLMVRRQTALPATYDGVTFDLGYRPDIIVNGEAIVEVKAVASLLPIHTAQLITYLSLSGIRRGLLINFHADPLVKGIKRVVLTSDHQSVSFLDDQNHQ